jgi:hypothetical protein
MGYLNTKSISTTVFIVATLLFSDLINANVNNAKESNSRVYIVSPKNDSVVKSPVEIIFGIDEIKLAPAGTYEPKTGHHHLIIDGDLPDLKMPIPNNAKHLHFGKAQDRVILELELGTHTLQLLLGDGYHVPHSPPLTSKQIEITVIKN